jgi:hypothetical protein
MLASGCHGKTLSDPTGSVNRSLDGKRRARKPDAAQTT